MFHSTILSCANIFLVFNLVLRVLSSISDGDLKTRADRKFDKKVQFYESKTALVYYFIELIGIIFSA